MDAQASSDTARRGPDETLPRAAVSEDVFQMIACLERGRPLVDGSHYPAPDMPYYAQALLDQIAQGLAVVLEGPDGTIVGCMVLTQARWPWTHPSNPRGYYLLNEQWWIDPRFRRGGAGLKFLKWAKMIAEQREMGLMIDLSTPDGNEKVKDRFVRQNRFRYLGGKFFFENRPKVRT